MMIDRTRTIDYKAPTDTQCLEQRLAYVLSKC